MVEHFPDSHLAYLHMTEADLGDFALMLNTVCAQLITAVGVLTLALIGLAN